MIPWSILAALLLAACANPLHHERTVQAGHRARAQGDFATAERMYRDALTIARRGPGLGADSESVDLHNLALAKRDLCQLEEAERLFRESLRLKEGSRTIPRGHVSGTVFELAHLLYERRKYAEAAVMFDRGLSILELGGLEAEPFAFGDLLEEHADGLRKIGDVGRAAALETRARALRDPAARPAFKRPPFNHPPCPA